MRWTQATRAIFLATLTGLALSSCDDAGQSPDTDGGPFGAVHTDGQPAAGGAAGIKASGGAGGGAGSKGPTDGGADVSAASGGAGGAKDASATDTKMDTPGSGTGGGTSAGTGGSTTAGNGTGGTTGQSCMQCETANCNKGVTKTAYVGCYSPVDDQGNPAVALAGPSMGTPKSQLCAAVLSCVREHMCEDETGDIVPNCYCGAGVDATLCSTTAGIQTGSCKTQFENAAEVTSPQSAPSEVGGVLDDASNALGAATRLLERCDFGPCRGPCLGLPDLPGSGGSGSAQSGTGGNGTSTGSGGAVGSGGTLASGTGSGGSTEITYSQCTACEMMTMGGCRVTQRNCATATGTATAGPGMGKAKSDLCMAAVICARQSGCAEPSGDVSKCYCGTANQENGDCYAKGLGNGACRSQIEAAAESTTPQDISDRLVNADPSNPSPYVMGFASALVACDIAKCDALCSMGDPPGGGAGGSTGSGGGSATASGGSGGTATGTGGGPGTGGANASGGAIASGGTVGSGGVVATGGAVGSGGVVATGGTIGSGGGTLLVANPDFATDGSSWTAEFSMLATWTAGKDAAAGGTSGGLGVTNVVVADVDGITIGGARQCVPVSAGIALTVSSQIFVPSGQGSTSAAGIEIDFFPSAGCAGLLAGQYTSSMVTATDSWKTVQGATATPISAQSMAVRLVVSKTFRSMAFEAYFDNVLVKGP